MTFYRIGATCRQPPGVGELLAGRDRLSRHRQAARQRGGPRQAAGAARSARQAADHPLGLSQPRAQPGCRWGEGVEAPRGHRLRHRHGKPRSGGVRGSRAGVGFKGFGFYPRSGFMHIDLGPARSWGERFPKRVSAFAPETPPAREVLAESRTLKGGGAAGVATVGAAGVEVAQQVLAETQGAVLPLVPYLDTLRWLFIAVALAGSPWRSTRGSTTGSGAGDDRRPRRPTRPRPERLRRPAPPRCRRCPRVRPSRRGQSGTSLILP